MEMAASLHFKEDDVPVALKFLSDYNLIVYYDTILPDIVFATPQVLLDKVTELTECVYKLAEKKEPEGIKQSPHRGEYLAMRDEGKVSNLIFKDFTRYLITESIVHDCLLTMDLCQSLHSRSFH